MSIVVSHTPAVRGGYCLLFLPLLHLWTIAGDQFLFILYRKMQQQDHFSSCPPPTRNASTFPAPPVYSQQMYMPQNVSPQQFQQHNSPGQAAGGQAQPQQTVVYQRTQSRVWPRYRSKSSNTIGWIQIVIGVLCISFNAVGLLMQKYRDYKELNATFMVGAGFWGSIFFFLSGGFAIGAARHKTTSMIVANMVFSIISTLFALGVLSTGASAIGVEKSDVIHWNKAAFFSFHEVPRQNTRQHRASLAMGVLLVGLALLEFICCIWSSVICCSTVCCGESADSAMTMAQTQVIFVNNPQQAPGGTEAGQGLPGNQTVVVTNPGLYPQPPSGSVYPTAPNAPPAYDSSAGPLPEKQSL